MMTHVIKDVNTNAPSADSSNPAAASGDACGHVVREDCPDMQGHTSGETQGFEMLQLACDANSVESAGRLGGPVVA